MLVNWQRKRTPCALLVKAKVLVTQSGLTLRHHGLQPSRLLYPWNSLGPNTGVGSLSLLQRIFPTLELNPDLLHCRQILHCLWVGIYFIAANIVKIVETAYRIKKGTYYRPSSPPLCIYAEGVKSFQKGICALYLLQLIYNIQEMETT